MTASSFPFRISDWLGSLHPGLALCAALVMSGCTGPGNFAPELAPIADQTSVSGRSIATLKSLGADKDNLVLTYEPVQLPDGLSINQHTGWISGTPSKPGTYPVQIKVSDREGAYAIRSFTWTVRKQGFDYRREGNEIVFTADDTSDAGTTHYCITTTGGRPSDKDACWKTSEQGGRIARFTITPGQEITRHYLWTRDESGKMQDNGIGAPFSEALFNAAFKSVRPVVAFNTTLGELAIELEDMAAPISTENFLKYAEIGFYDGLVFHRIISDFMVQTGGYSWTEADGYSKKPTPYPAIELERTPVTNLRHIAGTVGMARTNVPDSATSEFFINTVDNPFLDYAVDETSGAVTDGYAVFGRVIYGADTTLERLRAVTVGPNPSNPRETSQPVGEPPRILNALRIN